MKNVTAVARVQVVLEVDAGSWGAACTIGQATAQARAEAENRVRALIGTVGAVRLLSTGKVDIALREDDA